MAKQKAYRRPPGGRHPLTRHINDKCVVTDDGIVRIDRRRRPWYMSRMPENQIHFKELSNFFARDVCQRATKPLRDGIEIAVHVAGGEAMTLAKRNGRAVIELPPPKKADMTFQVPERALHELTATTTEDIGEIGIAILKLMAHSDPQMRVIAKVHIGLFDLLRNGYLGVLPLGGVPVTKFLASKGFNGVGKIKDAISRLRT